VNDSGSLGNDFGRFVNDSGSFANDFGQFVNDSGSFANDFGRFVNDSGSFANDFGRFVNDSGSFANDFGRFVNDSGCLGNQAELLRVHNEKSWGSASGICTGSPHFARRSEGCYALRRRSKPKRTAIKEESQTRVRVSGGRQ